MSCGSPAKENGCYNINVLRVLEHSQAGGPFLFLDIPQCEMVSIVWATGS